MAAVQEHSTLLLALSAGKGIEHFYRYVEISIKAISNKPTADTSSPGRTIARRLPIPSRDIDVQHNGGLLITWKDSPVTVHRCAHRVKG